MPDLDLPSPQPPPALPSDPSPVAGVIQAPPSAGGLQVDTKHSEDELKQIIANSLAALEIDPGYIQHALTAELAVLAAEYSAQKSTGHFIGNDKRALQARGYVILGALAPQFQAAPPAREAHARESARQGEDPHHGGHDKPKHTGR